MRLLILFISFLISQVADSQIISASPPYRVRASGCTAKLLDTYSGAAVAYSVRLLGCQYAGALIRVRRSSDNTEQDINATANGDLDTASLKTFVGTGGTDDGFVVTWYDQSSGSIGNATQATTTMQPLIMDNGVVLRMSDLPTVVFDGSNDRLELARADLSAGSMFCALKRVSTSTYQNFFYIGQSATARGAFETALNNDGSYGPIIVGSDGNNTTYGKGGSLRNTEDRVLTTIWLGTGTSGATHYNAYDDNTSVTLSNSGNVPPASNGISLIGAGVSSGVITNYFGGRISEIVFYNADKSSDRSAINTAINAYYTIY